MTPRRTVVEWLEPGVAVLASGERVPADVVVYATGYELALPFLPADVAARVFDADGYLRLYRNILPPDVPGLGFVGFNSAIASPLAAELAAHWLAAAWSGRMRLPPAGEMHAHVAAELRWRIGCWPESTRALRNACVGLQHRYMDGLMREMGRPPKLPGVRAAMRAMRPADYAGLLASEAGASAGPSAHSGQQIADQLAGLTNVSRARAVASASPICGPRAWRYVPEWHSSPGLDVAATRTSAHATWPVGAMSSRRVRTVANSPSTRTAPVVCLRTTRNAPPLRTPLSSTWRELAAGSPALTYASASPGAPRRLLAVKVMRK